MNADVTGRSRPHAIDHLEFAFDFRSEEAALSQQAWLERFIKQEAQPLIEQVFDECGGETDVLSVDRLEIDLGASSGRGEQDVLGARLRERLRVALGDARAAALRQGARTAVVPGNVADLKSLLHFLGSGRLQWNDTDAIGMLARRVSLHDSAALDANLLHADAQADVMRRRWAAQFGIDGLPEATRAWMVLERALVDARPGPWRQAWHTLFRRRPAALRELFRGLGRHVRVRRRMLAGLSSGMRDELFGLLADTPVAALHAVIAAAARRRQGLDAGLWECLLAHLCLEPLGTALPDAESLLAWTDELDGLGGPARLRWEALFPGDEADGLSAAWRTLWRNDRAGLRRLVRRQGTGRAMRGLLGAGAPAGLRQQALELLAPGDGEALGAFMAQACAWHARTCAGAQDGFDDWLWQQAVGLLLAPGATPSAASCIAVLLQKMAERHRISAVDVGLELRSSLQAAPQGLAASLRVVHILDGLATARVPVALPRPPSPVFLTASVDRRIAALCARLKQQVPLSIDEARRWEVEARALLSQHGEALKPALRATLEMPRVASRLTALLPPSSLSDVLRLLRPREQAQAEHCVRLLAQACEEVDPVAKRRLEPLGWQFLLRELVAEGRRFAVAAFSGRFLDFVADKLRWTGRSGWRGTVQRAMGRVASGAAQTLAREIAAGLHGSEAPARAAADVPGEPSPVGGQLVSHAGLVLAAPYLERLFSMLGLLKEQDFIDEAAQERALHVLHWLATGEDQAAEPALLLPKFLCGMEASVPVVRRIALQAREREAVDGLLAAMIGHWRVLGTTSVTGLRQTFLRREGRLVRENDRWRLDVAAGPYDMLLDHLPWGYGTVRLPWMAEVLHVEWR